MNDVWFRIAVKQGMVRLSAPPAAIAVHTVFQDVSRLKTVKANIGLAYSGQHLVMLECLKLWACIRRVSLSLAQRAAGWCLLGISGKGCGRSGVSLP